MITHPFFLWLLCLLPLLALALRRSLAALTPRRRTLCLCIRAAILALLILALAGLRFSWQSHELAVVFALDRSASIAPEAAQAGREFLAKSLAGRGRGDSATLLGFAGTVTTLDLSGVSQAHPSNAWPEQPNRDRTDIARALAFSAAVFPEGKTKRLVVLSDGNDTSGSAAGLSQAAKAIQASGVELYTVPLDNPFRPEVLVERLDIPALLREGEPFDATAVIRSNVETGCAVRLYGNGFLAGEQTVKLKPGTASVVFRNLRPPEGRSGYSVEISPDLDTVLENNRAQATTIQRGKARVLIVDASEGKLEPLKRALQSGTIELEVRSVDGLPVSIADLQKYDALLLSDVPAHKLNQDQMQLYAQWVREFGGGFAMLGGENSFGVGGYFHTPIEAMLPVRMDHDDAAESPAVAVMIILDSSGSMSAPVAGQTKMALADQGAALALDVLQPKDLLGVLAVDTHVHQIATLTRHDDRPDVIARIRHVTAGGGGIYIYTSLVEAFAQLREVNAKIKHVILFSDAADAEEKASGEVADGSQVPGNAMDLVSTMASARITTSAVGLGNAGDKDVAFLKQLATNGSGRFYLTDDALTLPQIFTAETMRVAQSSLLEEPFIVQKVHNAPVLEGIDWEKSPPLDGCNLTKLKPAADLLLATEHGDPILATWRVGLGQVAVFTSDVKSRWASEWLAWPGYGKFWVQLVRSLVRPANVSGIQTQIVADDQHLRVQVDALAPDGTFRNQLPLTVTAMGANNPVKADQIAPGRYRAELPISGTGATWISVQSPALPEGGDIVAYTPPYPAEFLNNGTNREALIRLADPVGGRFGGPELDRGKTATDGIGVTPKVAQASSLLGGAARESGVPRFDPKPETVFEHPKLGTRRTTDLTAALLSLALLLLPVDVWLRRRSSS